MAYSAELADRIRNKLARRSGVVERKMFGGLGFMIGGNMCCGVDQNELLVRVPRADFERLIARPHARAMAFPGRRVTGFVMVAEAGWKDAKSFARWLKIGTDYAVSLPPKT